ncbi:MAG TPA: DNA translocase FtsK, partial [Skermanella sp.]|nr:DNA translocase FtsK [Skermanella sp.]
MTQQESRQPIDAAISDITTAEEFNLGCALNRQPFKLRPDEWSDGAVEWVLEMNPGRPSAIIAYGTGQREELYAVIAANAFLAGVEWGEATAKAPMIGPDDDEEESILVAGAGDGEFEIEDNGVPVEDLIRDPDAPYELPPVDLLEPAPQSETLTMDELSLAHNARNLETVLKNFGVRGEIMEVRPGPVVTLYELEPAPGLKSSRVINLAEDIARSMRALTVRIAVVPGRSVIGIELPNPTREKVFLREMLDCDAYQQTAAKLALVLGKDIGGTPIIVDLARM